MYSLNFIPLTIWFDAWILFDFIIFWTPEIEFQTLNCRILKLDSSWSKIKFSHYLSFYKFSWHCSSELSWQGRQNRRTIRLIFESRNPYSKNFRMKYVEKIIIFVATVHDTFAWFSIPILFSNWINTLRWNYRGFCTLTSPVSNFLNLRKLTYFPFE